MRTWRELNPTFRYELWDDVRLRCFNFKNSKQISESKELAGKADVMRYEILERLGGIYVDADAECIRPLDDEFLEHEAFCCYENELVRPALLSNGYLGSVPGGTLVQELVRRLEERNVNAARAWVTTGTLYLTHTAWLSKAPLHIYPSHYFIPQHYSGAEYHGTGPIYAKQYWGSTKGIYA